MDALFKTPQTEKLTQAARQSLAGHYIDQNAKPWLITYATQTGLRNNSRGVRQRAQEAHQPVQVKSVQQLTEADLQQHEQILFVISTYGTGEAPDLASNFAKVIKN